MRTVAENGFGFGENITESGFSNQYPNKDLIKECLLDNCPDMDLGYGGTDQLIYQTCCNDLFMYLQYLRRNHMEIDASFNEYFSRYILGRALNEHRNYISIPTVKVSQYRKDAEEFAKFLVTEWYHKFLKRTKVVFKNNPDAVKAQMKFSINIHDLFTQKEWDELSLYIQGILFCNGERCFIGVLVENLVKNCVMTLGKMTLSKNDKIQFMESIGAEAKRMCYSTGPLIWVFPNLKVKLREWRGDNEAVQS